MRKNLALVILISVTAVTACGGSSSTETTTQAPVETVAETTAEALTIEETTEAETEPAIVNDYEWDAGDLADFGLDRDEIFEICTRYKELMWDEDAMSNYNDEDEYYDLCRAQVAEEYGLDDLDVDTIYFTAGAKNYYATFDVDNVKLKYGDLQDVMVNDDNIIVLKAKIEPSLTKNMTVEQNYYTVCDFIKTYLGDNDYTELQYMAVADMTDGSESKCVSFTVPQSVIEWIESGDFIDNQLGDYVEDLWILPSLRD